MAARIVATVPQRLELRSIARATNGRIAAFAETTGTPREITTVARRSVGAIRVIVSWLALASLQALAQTAPSITSANNTAFSEGLSGTFTVTATGNPSPTFTETGALPSGVTLASSGVLSGTPAPGTAGIYNITITASNFAGQATQNFTLSVGDDDGFMSLAAAFCAKDLPPVPTITTPANGATVAPNVAITIAATSPNPANVSQVQFFAGTALVCTDPYVPSGQYSCSWTPTATSGTVALTAVVIDRCSKQGTSSTVTVTIDTPPYITLNTPTASQILNAPATIVFDASAQSFTSAISEVDFLSSGSLVGRGSTTCCNDYQYSWTNVLAGSYQLSAKAIDTFGLYTVTAPVTVVVANPPTVALTSPPNNQVVSPNTAVSVVANPTADTANGRSVSTVTVQAKNSNNVVVWGPINVFSPGYSTTWTPTTTGVFTLTATVTDSRGATAMSAPVTLIVDVPPTVTASSDNSLLRAPATFHLSATAVANVGSIQSVTFYNGSTVLAAGTPGVANTYTYIWSNVGVGTYTVTARAIDSYGGTTTSSAITLTVDNGGSTTVYYHNDFAGSPLAATNASGGVLWSGTESYAPYGERYFVRDTSTRNGIWFVGKPTEDSSGLTYFGGRWYNPMVGRFYSVDPQRFRDSNPLSFNRYAYGNSNPYRFIDPNGYSPLEWGMLAVDLVRLGVAIYNGSGSRDVAIDVGIDLVTGPIPVPGVALGIRELRTAKAAAELAAKAANATHEGSAAVSTYRYTTEGETFFHYGYAAQSESFAGGLRPGSFATSTGDLTGTAAQGAMLESCG